MAFRYPNGTHRKEVIAYVKIEMLRGTTTVPVVVIQTEETKGSIGGDAD
jgi:hypothetical protein